MWKSIGNFFANLWAKLFGQKSLPAPVATLPPPVPTQIDILPIQIPMQKGAVGPDVVVLQDNLREVGCDPGASDGKFGDKTEAALKLFQQKKGMQQTGILDDKGLKALSAHIHVGAPPVTPVQPEPIQPLPPTDDLLSLIEHAKKYERLHESGGNNRGPYIDVWLKAIGVPLGSSWCMAFVQAMIKEVEKESGVKSRIHRSAGCLDVWNNSPKDMRDANPQPGDIIIWRHGQTYQGHTGIVIKRIDTHSVQTIEGNTGPVNTHVDPNGDGVYVKTRLLAGQGDMKVMGFIRPFDK